MVISTAKKHVPRGVRKDYIPGWSEANEKLYNFMANGQSEIADLLQHLDELRRAK